MSLSSGDSVPFKLTPFYAAPELAAAALETMRVGQLPPLEYARATAATEADGEGVDRWGPNLTNLVRCALPSLRATSELCPLACRRCEHRALPQVMLSENPTLARAVAATSSAANQAGGGGADFNRDELRQLEAPLRMANGKPLRASTAMDVWSLGLIAYELFTSEPFFAGCSDDVALQVGAGAAREARRGSALAASPRAHPLSPRLASPRLVSRSARPGLAFLCLAWIVYHRACLV